MDFPNVLSKEWRGDIIARSLLQSWFWLHSVVKLKESG
jgi:hypothetical protein